MNLKTNSKQEIWSRKKIGTLAYVLTKLRDAKVVGKNIHFWRCSYTFFQNFIIKNEFRKNATLKNIHKGKRCFIFGNGRSLADVDLLKFNHEYTFGCNEIFLKNDFDKHKLSFYASVDSLYGYLRRGMDYENPNYFFPKVERSCADEKTLFFFDISTRDFQKKRGLFKNRLVHYIAARVKKNRDHPEIIDLDQRNDFSFGSLFFMIATSIYMGFKELYLMGMGYTFHPTYYCHFWDNQKAVDGAKSFESLSIDPRHHDILRIARENGVSIYNVVPEGFKSPVYNEIGIDKIYELIK